MSKRDRRNEAVQKAITERIKKISKIAIDEFLAKLRIEIEQAFIEQSVTVTSEYCVIEGINQLKIGLQFPDGDYIEI